MKKEKANRQKIRRYLDGLYSKSEVSDLLKSMQDRDMQSAFEEISDEIWEESMKYQPYVCDMEHEQYKQEAARLLKKIFYIRKCLHRLVKKKNGFYRTAR